MQKNNGAKQEQSKVTCWLCGKELVKEEIEMTTARDRGKAYCFGCRKKVYPLLKSLAIDFSNGPIVCV